MTLRWSRKSRNPFVRVIVFPAVSHRGTRSHFVIMSLIAAVAAPPAAAAAVAAVAAVTAVVGRNLGPRRFAAQRRRRVKFGAGRNDEMALWYDVKGSRA
jgi:hypothetical protein